MLNKQYLLITNSDAVSQKLVMRLCQNIDPSMLILIVDYSKHTGSVFRLWRKKRIAGWWIVRMLWAMLMQRLLLIRMPSISKTIKQHVIGNNQDLRHVLNLYPDIQTVFCFRAGLVIDAHNIDSKTFLNIHCARLPEYGGLMAIARAYKARDVEQCCTLHHVTTRIDSGEVLMTAPYTLDLKRPYWKNDWHAYTTGVGLLTEAMVRFG